MTVFTETERRSLTELRARVDRQGVFFTPRQMEQLRFLRWLVATGRLVS